MNTPNKVGLQINMQQILNVLSSSLYKGDVLSVATRELLQNSFDAVKKQRDPRIDVSFSYRTLTFVDNGYGMTPETVRNVFFTVGGTLKEGLDPSERSGGFGIAKVQFFMAAESLHVESVRHGLKTIVDATQTELLNGDGKLLVEHTSEPSGTRVVLTFPSSYTDDKGINRNLYYYSSSVTNVLKRPLIGYNIPIFFNECIIESNFKATNKITESFDWGTCDIYYTPTLSGGNRIKYRVYCSGLYQFDKSERFIDEGGIEVDVNILPKYVAGQKEYPFANSRDDFSGYVKPYIDKIGDSLVTLVKFIKSEKVRNEYSSFGKLTYMEMTSTLPNKEIVGVTNNTLDLESLFKTVGSLEGLLKVVKEIKDKRAEEDAAMKKAKQDNKEDSLKLINKMGLEINHTRQELFSKVASIIYDVIYIPDIRREFKVDASTCGVILDNMRGCYLKLDVVGGIYLNPMGVFQNANHFANTMMEALVHELAHTYDCYGCHDDGFFRQMGSFRNIFWMLNIYESLTNKFMSLYMQYSDVLNPNK